MVNKQDYSNRFNLKRSISKGKRKYFDMVRNHINDGDYGISEDEAMLREQAIEAFTAELDSKIASMRPGQYLSLSYRVEVINSDGSGVKEPSARTSPEAHAWRNEVFARDGYKCVECGHNGRLQAHHVVPWSESVDLRFDISNGVTLCVDCHKAKHPQHAALIERSRYHKGVK